LFTKNSSGEMTLKEVNFVRILGGKMAGDEALFVQ
jgi:hypothetical protein